MSSRPVTGLAPAQPVKNFKLKPMTKPKTLDSGPDEVLSRVIEAIIQINNSNSSHLSFEELYRHAYNLVLHKHGESLYNGVTHTIRDHLLSVREKVRNVPDELLLRRLREAWERHTLNMRKIKDILMYMDRTFVPPSRKPTIYEQGTILFREVIARFPEIKDRVLWLLLLSIRNSRTATSPITAASTETNRISTSGPELDISLMRNILSMLMELGVNSNSVYMEDFEAPMLAETSQFYHDESNEVLAMSTCVDYMKYAERRINEEHERVQFMMTPVAKLLGTVERRLLAEHAISLISMEGSGLLFQLEHDRYDDIKRMFLLLQRVKTPIPWTAPVEIVSSEKDRERHAIPVGILKDTMKAKIIREGWKIVFDTELQKEPSKLVQQLLHLRDKYMKIVEQAFHGDRLFVTGMKEAFENVVNRQEPGRPAAAGPNVVSGYLAAYVDECMTKEFKSLSESEINDVLDKVILLFRALSSKDVFEEHYKDKTAKRLLGGKIISEDIEKMMISKLKQECGTNYTNKLEGMFVDLSKSAKFMEAFKADQSATLAALPVDLDATVLTSAHWEGRGIVASPLPRCFPAVVQSVAEQFHKYYLEKHSGRRLAWNYTKGTADIRSKFSLGTGKPVTYEITVSTYQMVLLMAFNEHESIPFRDFATYNIPEDELRRHLLSLTNPKMKILNKSTSKKEVLDEDVFSVNDGFVSKLMKIKVPLISMKSAHAAGHATGASAGGAEEDILGSVEGGRKSLLDSVIVRIMKTRKHMEYNALIGEVIRMVSNRFLPQPSDIKKRIEDLMERDYIERSPDNPNVYSYLA